MAIAELRSQFTLYGVKAGPWIPESLVRIACVVHGPIVPNASTSRLREHACPNHAHAPDVKMDKTAKMNCFEGDLC
jgi:hypothetical protein